MTDCLEIGLVYETHETYAAAPDAPADFAAEYEPEATIDALEAAIAGLSHRPRRVGAPHALLRAIALGELAELDAALSIAEGYGTRNREAWAPVLLDMAGVPQLGSDPLTLSLSLDKAWTQAVVERAGVPVAAARVVRSGAEALEGPLPAAFPLFVKPRWEGTSKGIRPSSRVEDRQALAAEVERVQRDYAQPAWVEAFLPGAEYTVSVIGNAPPRALPALQRALERDTGIGLHALEGEGGALAWSLPGALDAALEAELGSLALAAFNALECRDFARADFRLDARGRPHFLEINPLPTFDPQGSFGILAELAGRTHAELVGDALAAGLERLGLARPGARGGVAA